MLRHSGTRVNLPERLAVDGEPGISLQVECVVVHILNRVAADEHDAPVLPTMLVLSGRAWFQPVGERSHLCRDAHDVVDGRAVRELHDGPFLLITHAAMPPNSQ